MMPPLNGETAGCIHDLELSYLLLIVNSRNIDSSKKARGIPRRGRGTKEGGTILSTILESAEVDKLKLHKRSILTQPRQ